MAAQPGPDDAGEQQCTLTLKHINLHYRRGYPRERSAGHQAGRRGSAPKAGRLEGQHVTESARACGYYSTKQVQKTC